MDCMREATPREIEQEVNAMGGKVVSMVKYFN